MATKSKEEIEREIAAAERRSKLQAAAAKEGEKLAEKNKRTFSEADIKRGERRGKEEAMGWGPWAADVIGNAVVGTARGAASIPGTPVDIYRLGNLAKAYTSGQNSPFARFTGTDPKYFGKTTSEVLAQQDAEREAGVRGTGIDFLKPSNLDKYSGEAWADTLLGPSPPPETRAGEIARGVGEVTGGAAIGGLANATLRRAGPREAARMARREAGTGLATGVGMEAAGAIDPDYKTAAGLVVGPLAGMYGSRTAEDAIRRATRGAEITPQQVDAARQLFMRARAENLPVSMASAIDWASGGRGQGLSELQRVIESSGSPELLRFYADNAPPGPTRVRAAIERRLGTVGPESQEPSTIGQRVQPIMAQNIEGAQQQSNVRYRQGMQQFGQNAVPPADFQAAMANPLWARTHQQVLNDPELEPLIRGFAPDSVAVVDLVNRRVGELQQARQTPGESAEGMSRTRAEGIRQQLGPGEQAASQGSVMPGQPVPPGGQTPLQQAQQYRAQDEATMVRPLTEGPEGALAAPNATTQSAKGAIFPGSPVEGQHVEINRAMGTLAQQDPNLARELLRNYLGTEMETALKPNIAGQPPTAGTKWWNRIAGPEGSQRELNLRGAFEALPNGQAIWQGFREIGDIMEAMGKRQHPGSKTAFNIEDVEALKGKNEWTDAGKKAVTGQLSALWNSGADAIESWRLGQNKAEVTRLLTDPQAHDELARIIADTAPGSAERTARYLGLLAQQAILAQQMARPAVDNPLYAPPDQPLTFTVTPGGQQ